ncbi:MAG TPA: NYN domain-containing protein, partial [Thermoanaerobaculia bacterium]|nr:NYN domain-containing protein [Thermoanaerobaculia bacterium]
MSRKPNFENDAAEDDGNVGSPPSRSSMNESKIALFIDFENIAIGVADAKFKKFEVALLLERLLEKGKIVVKRAYSDWDKFPDYKRELHEAAIELIEIPGRVYSGKNSADIRMVVDAMDMAWSKDHINIFVVASGDSDFSPLVSKLKENDKHVIGVGVKNSSSDLLIDNCDEFIFYEDLVRGTKAPSNVTFKDKKQGEVFKLLIDSIKALMRENKEILWGSMVKQTMQRKKPTFNEEYYGYNT